MQNQTTNAAQTGAADLPPRDAPEPKKTWREALQVYLEPASLRMFALGFSAGLPLLLVFGTLSFWLREAGVNRATIGFISWVTLAYAFKWCWAPLVDRLPIPVFTRMLGRRRSWLLLAQIGVVIGLVGMAFSDPKVSIHAIVWFALLVAFSSATQDIALDAFRIESGDKERQSALSATYQMGYRIAMIWAGAGVLWIAARAEVANPQNYDVNAWKVAYLVMAASMIVGFATVLFSKEPAPQPLTRPKNVFEWLQSALIEPFADFFRRYKWHAALILALIATYRISDIVMGIMANPFYVDMGYTKDEVASIAKVYGVIMTLVGAFVGGVLSIKIGMMRTLMLGAILSAASNLLFAWLTTRGHDVQALTLVISIDNLSAGIASTAFIAYMSSLTNISYSATQYALLSSMMLLLPKWIAGFSGVAVNAVGYPSFFIGTAMLGVPVLILIWIASRKLK
ncbi:MAG: MFS transporter [Burkholderiales bacterium]|nr:MAG: MFS transporter [Burkholderiales bacterium]TAG79772.1 MAG: MFS transporter [Betaproteobacteria bacterium]